eukprot:569267-Prorocentrum_lima.AAC.1
MHRQLTEGGIRSQHRDQSRLHRPAPPRPVRQCRRGDMPRPARCTFLWPGRPRASSVSRAQCQHVAHIYHREPPAHSTHITPLSARHPRPIPP